MELPLILTILTEEANKVFQRPPLRWYHDQPNPNDIQIIQSEALQDSEFDPLLLRRRMWEKVLKGEAHFLAKSCGIAKVLWIKTFGTTVEPPWELWGRIFQWLGPSSSGVPWRIFWLPAEDLRVIPPLGHKVGPKHINGGYCYPCRPDTIMIYRFEEASRVLLHELLHAACLDPPGHPLPFKEANTETWAELFMIAVCSKGNKEAAKHLWKLQSHWIADQNTILKKRYHVYTPEDYAWRYTLGREVILHELHIKLPKGKIPLTLSCRLTTPELCM
jgi:hypothetical protein